MDTITAARYIDIDHNDLITPQRAANAAEVKHLNRLLRDGTLALRPALGWGDYTHLAHAADGETYPHYLVVLTDAS